MDPGNPSPGATLPPPPARGAALRMCALLAAAIVAIAGLRIALVANYANSEPYSDEWDAVMALPVRLIAVGRYSLSELFRPHNEHTVAPSRLVSTMALWLNHNQFDNVPVVLFNAVLFALVWSALIYLFYRHAPDSTRAFAAVLAIAGLVPIEGADVLFGFDNVYYFLIAGATATLWLAASASSGRRRHVIAFALAAFGATVCMGSGFMAPLVAASICGLRMLCDHAPRRVMLIRIAIGLAATITGLVLLLRTGLVHSSQIDLAGLGRALSCLAWPYANSAWAGVVLSLPIVALLVRTIRLRSNALPIDYFAIALGVWSAAQIAAVAMDRHADATSLQSRYLNVVLLWPLMNLFSLVRLTGAASRRDGLQQALVVLPAAAGAVLIGILVAQAPRSYAAITLASQQHVEQAARIARYVRLGDVSALSAEHMALPYPDVRRLKALLDDPALRTGLPPNLRAPLALGPASTEAGDAFVPHGVFPTTPNRDTLPDLGSFTEKGNPNTGVYLSQPLHSTFPFVFIGVAGYLSSPNLSLRLSCVAESDCRTVEVRPSTLARESWQDVLVPVRETDFRLRAEDDSPNLWFAFSAPIEAGRLSVSANAFAYWIRSDPIRYASALSAIVALLLLYALHPAGRNTPCRGETG